MDTLNDTKSERIKAAIKQMEHRWGSGVLVTSRAAQARAEGLSTTFPALDQLTGVGGIPLHAVTLLAGNSTSGKLTVAYKVLSRAQQGTPERRHSVAILDLGASSDPDYISRSGVDLDRLLLVRPQSGKQVLRVLLDLVKSRELRAILLDSLSELLVDKEGASAVEQMMPQVNLALKSADCALLLLDEARPPWLPSLAAETSRAVRHYASLHVEFLREGWIESEGECWGYRVRARLLKSRSQRQGESATLAIAFNETVRARETW
ncbi:MAG: DNA recombination/repair protein RecA [Chloroflexi bacterium]|nr:DNA recombination/repair protein RecA [Chloroflexota bacterium]